MNVIRATKCRRYQVVDLVSSRVGPQNPVFFEYSPLKSGRDRLVVGMCLRAHGSPTHKYGGARSEPGIGNVNNLSSHAQWAMTFYHRTCSE